MEIFEIGNWNKLGVGTFLPIDWLRLFRIRILTFYAVVYDYFDQFVIGL